MIDSSYIGSEVLACSMLPTLDLSHTLPRHATKIYDRRDISDISRIVVHTTDWNCTPEELANYDISPNHISSTGCPAITYHGLITQKSEWIKTLPYNEVSWHVGPWNPGSVGIALVYRVSDENGQDTYAPRERQIKTLIRVCSSLCFNLEIEPTQVFGHRELKHTGWFFFKGSRKLRKTCPGMRVDLDEIRERVIRYVQLCLMMQKYYPGPPDGIWGPVSIAAFYRYLAERE